MTNWDIDFVRAHPKEAVDQIYRLLGSVKQIPVLQKLYGDKSDQYVAERLDHEKLKKLYLSCRDDALEEAASVADIAFLSDPYTSASIAIRAMKGKGQWTR